MNRSSIDDKKGHQTIMVGTQRYNMSQGQTREAVAETEIASSPSLARKSNSAVSRQVKTLDLQSANLLYYELLGFLGLLLLCI